MRHRMTTKRLNMPVGRRKAVLRSLLTQLYMQESIVTTKARGMTVKMLADRLIHQAKPRTVHTRRRLSRMVTDPQALKKLVDDLAVRYQDLSSGFTRIVPLGSRRGDNTLMVKLELTRRQSAIKPAAKEIAKSEKQESKQPITKSTTAAKKATPKTKAKTKSAPAKKKPTVKSKPSTSKRKNTSKK